MKELSQVMSVLLTDEALDTAGKTCVDVAKGRKVKKYIFLSSSALSKIKRQLI